MLAPRYSFFSCRLADSVCGNFWHFGDFVEIFGWEVGGRGFVEIVGATGALWKLWAPVGPHEMETCFLITILKKKIHLLGNDSQNFPPAAGFFLQNQTKK